MRRMSLAQRDHRPAAVGSVAWSPERSIRPRTSNDERSGDHAVGRRLAIERVGDHRVTAWQLVNTAADSMAPTGLAVITDAASGETRIDICDSDLATALLLDFVTWPDSAASTAQRMFTWLR